MICSNPLNGCYFLLHMSGQAHQQLYMVSVELVVEMNIHIYKKNWLLSMFMNSDVHVHEFRWFGAMDSNCPSEFRWFGALDIHFPYEFTGFGVGSGAIFSAYWSAG